MIYIPVQASMVSLVDSTAAGAGTHLGPWVPAHLLRAGSMAVMTVKIVMAFATKMKVLRVGT